MGFKALTVEDTVGYEKVERLKIPQGYTDYLRPLQVELTHPGDGSKCSAVFFEHVFYAGRRSDGSNWVVTAHDDPRQNFAEHGAGQKQQSAFACVVLHLIRVDQRTNGQSLMMRCMVWTGGPDKWRKLKDFEKQHGSLAAHEIIAACESKVDSEKYQNLMLSLVNPAEHLLPRILQSDPTLEPKLHVSFTEAVADLAALMKPMTYVEQQAAIIGRTGTAQAGPGAFAPGFGPGGGAPAGGFAPALAPAAARPSFMGPAQGAPQLPPAAPTGFAPGQTGFAAAPPQQAALPFAPPAGLPTFGQTPPTSFLGQPANAPVPTAPQQGAPVAATAPPANDPVNASFATLVKQMSAPPATA